LQSWRIYPLQPDILKTIRENPELESAPCGALFAFWVLMTTKQVAGPPDLADLRQRITGMVAQNAVAMVQCAIDAVQEEGQYQAIKYLFEMIGLYPVAPGSEDIKPDSLTETLLKRLGLDD
jgi:hypothetical protein